MPYKDIEERRIKNNAFNKRKYLVRKAMAIEYLGGKCVDCATTRYLEFDHKDPAEKITTVGRIINYKWEKVQIELDKCELRCVGCHAYRTALQKLGLADVLGEIV